MAARMLLISCGATSATRRSAFPTDEPLLPDDDVSSLRARLAADRRWSRHTAAGESVVTGPELRCRETAAALGLTPAPDPAPADWNLGAWAGRTLDDLITADPASVATWLGEPSFVPPQGESLATFLGGTAAWLDAVPPRSARARARAASAEADDARAAGASSSPIVMVCTSAVMRAALTHALQAPPATFWRLDAAPLSTAELTGAPTRWSLRL